MLNDVKWYEWIRYSGVTATVHLNPLHWWAIPYFQRHVSELGERDMRWEFKFLFLKINVWFDDGRW